MARGGPLTSWRGEMLPHMVAGRIRGDATTNYETRPFSIHTMHAVVPLVRWQLAGLINEAYLEPYRQRRGDVNHDRRAVAAARIDACDMSVEPHRTETQWGYARNGAKRQRREKAKSRKGKDAEERG